MKRVSGTRKIIHKLIVNVVKDYYNGSETTENMSNIIKVIEGDDINLSDGGKADMFCIKANLNDETYIKSFVGE